MSWCRRRLRPIPSSLKITHWLDVKFIYHALGNGSSTILTTCGSWFQPGLVHWASFRWVLCLNYLRLSLSLWLRLRLCGRTLDWRWSRAMKRGSRSLHGRVNEIKSACSLTLQHNSRMVERVVNHEWHAKNMRQPTFFVKFDSEISQSMRPWHHRGFQHPPNEPGARSHKQHLDANAMDSLSLTNSGLTTDKQWNPCHSFIFNLQLDLTGTCGDTQGPHDEESNSAQAE